MTTRLWLVALTLLALSSPAEAEDKPITITFMARPVAMTPATFGHAFFCVSVPLQSGSKEDCFGFYPTDLKKAFDGPGKVASDLRPSAITGVTTSLRHEITEDARRRVYQTIERWAGADYKLLVNNCGDFLFDVAKVSGLAVPSRSSVLLPTDFVEGLKRLYWSGSWVSTDPGKRFLLAFSEQKADWTERAASGMSLTRTVSFAPQEGPTRIERNNGDEVLAFLGFQPTLRSQIVAQGPKPSYMILRRLDDRVVSQWYGLLVTKNEDASLKELKQPGSMPAKPYEMIRVAQP
jgi:hypothetical protein